MADIFLKYGTVQSLSATGLATLANGSSVTSSTIDNTTTLFLDFLIELVVSTASAATATGVVEIYAKGSADNTDFDDDSNDKWIGTIALPAAGVGTRKRLSGVASSFGGSLPPYVQIRVRNATGAALTAGTLQYIGVNAQTV